MRTFLRHVAGVALVGVLFFSDVGRFYLNNSAVVVRIAPDAEKEEESAPLSSQNAAVEEEAKEARCNFSPLVWHLTPQVLTLRLSHRIEDERLASLTCLLVFSPPPDEAC